MIKKIQNLKPVQIFENFTNISGLIEQNTKNTYMIKKSQISSLLIFFG